MLSTEKKPHPISLYLAKWWQTMLTAWSQYTTYRLNFFLLVLGPALIFFFIKYNLWSAIYGGNEDVILRGFNQSEMISYHALVLIVSLLAQGHSANNLSEEIRMGRISTYLIYPFNFWEYHSAYFLGFQALQLLVSLFTLGVFFLIGIPTALSLESLFLGILLCFFISIIWYMLQFLTGIMGFWLEETWILRVTLLVTASFLSGAIIPIDFYPDWFVSFLDKTPFPYLTYYPIKVFQGETQLIPTVIKVLTGWGIIISLLNYIVWKKGVRMYTGAGM